MIPTRKTVKVMEIKKRINNYLRDTKDSMKPEREAMAMFLESILMDVGSYKGFGYITKGSMVNSAEGTTFGIGEFNEATASHDWAGTDSSRVFYF